MPLRVEIRRRDHNLYGKEMDHRGIASYLCTLLPGGSLVETHKDGDRALMSVNFEDPSILRHATEVLQSTELPETLDVNIWLTIHYGIPKYLFPQLKPALVSLFNAVRDSAGRLDQMHHFYTLPGCED